MRGRFDLTRSIGFAFGGRPAAPDGGAGGTMRLAFVLDGYAVQAGVAVTQPAPDLVRFDVVGDVDPERTAAQAARVLSLDEDATGYDRMVDRDPVLRAAYAARPGLRPPLFHSAYEALVWAVLSARRPVAQMREVREHLTRAHGRLLDVAGEELRGLEGIGPFYAELVTMRTLGHPDVLPTTEPRVMAATAARLGLQSLSPTDFAEVAEAWRPWRSWACVALRAAA